MKNWSPELSRFGVSFGTRFLRTWKAYVINQIIVSNVAYGSTQVLLPLQTDPLLSSLYRTPKPQRTASPSSQELPASSSSTSTSTHHIDVRTVALRSFRDRVILPPFQRLYTRLSKHNRQDGFQDAHNYQQPRLKQMCVRFKLTKQDD